MNRIFRPYLYPFVVVFFYDVMIYSCIHEDHETHLRTTLYNLKEKQLYVNSTKCEF